MPLLACVRACVWLFVCVCKCVCIVCACDSQPCYHKATIIECLFSLTLLSYVSIWARWWAYSKHSVSLHSSFAIFVDTTHFAVCLWNVPSWEELKCIKEQRRIKKCAPGISRSEWCLFGLLSFDNHHLCSVCGVVSNPIGHISLNALMSYFDKIRR